MKKILSVLVVLFLAAGLFAQEDSVKGLSFDFGVEPNVDGNGEYTTVQYGWTDTIATRFDWINTNSVTTIVDVPDFANAYGTEKVNNLEINVLPFEQFFFLNDIVRLNYSIGASYQYTNKNSFIGMFDSNGLMLDSADEGKYFTYSYLEKTHIVAPRLGFDIRADLSDDFLIDYSVFVNPIYLVMMRQRMEYSASSVEVPFDYDGSNNIKKLSTPYINQKLSIYCFNLFRIATQYTFQRLNLQRMDWNEGGTLLTGYDDVQTMSSLRFGVELTSPETEKTNAKIKTGIFYQLDWFKSTYDDEKSRTGKFIINLGTEL